jgi:DNA phosphorothioation-dependent restriction protein DptF
MKKGTPQLHEVFEKLSLKSKEALVSGDSSLDEFHQYLHVPRPIEHEFEKVLKEVVPNNEQTLTLIVGNVGDGKSHLLAFEQSKNSVIFSEQNIQIHNDATESNSPKLTAIQTLIEKMDNFDGASGEKQHLVVAINMGILLRFANTVREKGQYTELLSFLDDSGILEDSNATSKIGDRFQLITFRDSPIFSFNGTGVQSDFIERLLSKITDASVKNPFYRAYEHDKGLAATPELSNYELLLNQNVQKSLELLLVSGW